MPRKGASGPTSSTSRPDSPESLIQWLNTNIPLAEHKVADRMAKDPGDGRFSALAMKTKAQGLRWRAKTLFKPAICGIERTEQGIILYCSSDKAAEILGQDYFVAQPLPKPMYEESALSESDRADARRQEEKRLAQIKAQHPYVEKNAIKLEMGIPQAIAELKRAIDLIHNPVADAVEIPSLFPEVPSILEVRNEEQRLADERARANAEKKRIAGEVRALQRHLEFHAAREINRSDDAQQPKRRAADRSLMDRLRPDAPAPNTPTGDQRRTTDRPHPMRRAWEVAMLETLPQENELVGSRDPIPVLQRLRRGTTTTKTGPRSP